MNSTRHGPHPRSRFSIFGHPIHAMLVPVPITCFVGALFTDIVYTQIPDIMWANFSAWLLAIGMAFAVAAAIAGAIDFTGDKRIRSLKVAWPHAIGNSIVLVLALFNNFVHSRDGWTSVLPTGITLSALTVIVMIVTVWLGRHMVYRHGVGVSA